MDGVGSKKKVFVTGAFGFLGGRLSKYINDCGYEVYMGSRSKERLPPNWCNKDRVILTSWNNLENLYGVLEHIDIVVHLAGVNASDSAANPEAAMNFNENITKNFMKISNRAGVKKFVYLSTAHVYADPLAGIISEESPTKNMHPYAVSHIKGERAVIELTQRSKIRGLVIRLSNAFGVPENKEVNCWNLVVNELCRQAVEQNVLTLTTRGDQKRDFIPLTDVCRAIGYFIELPNNFSERMTFNLGKTSLSVYEMAVIIQECCYEVLGYIPKINRPDNGEINKFKEFEYRMNWLKYSDFKFIADIRDEVRTLLHFCQKSFSKGI